MEFDGTEYNKEHFPQPTEIDPDIKAWIDAADYETLLRRWRFGPTGKKMMQGLEGRYYAKIMTEKRDADPAAAVRASKKVGQG